MLQHVFNLDQMHILHGRASSSPAHFQLSGLLGTGADQGSGWSWGQALGGQAPLLLPTPASPMPTLHSAVTK